MQVKSHPVQQSDLPSESTWESPTKTQRGTQLGMSKAAPVKERTGKRTRAAAEEAREELFSASREAAALGLQWTHAQPPVPAPRVRACASAASVRELWEAITAERSLHVTVRNWETGKRKQCGIEARGLSVKAEGETWDEARQRAAWLAVQRVDTALGGAWRRLHPREAERLDS